LMWIPRQRRLDADGLREHIVTDGDVHLRELRVLAVRETSRRIRCSRGNFVQPHMKTL
jgi:hypothetical protein